MMNSQISKIQDLISGSSLSDFPSELPNFCTKVDSNYPNLQSEDTLQSLANSVFDNFLSSDGKHNHKVEYNNGLSSRVGIQTEKQNSSFHSTGILSFSTHSSSSKSRNTIQSKKRIKWSQDLHEKFVECVNILGGAEKATPKGILKLMKSQGLTIFHVKSHLQKYRVSKYIKDPEEDKSERETCPSFMPQLDATKGMQIVEALRLQIDFQRRLYEQLKSQRDLQLRIEEQGKQLKKMLDSQIKIRKISVEDTKEFEDLCDSTSENICHQFERKSHVDFI